MSKTRRAENASGHFRRLKGWDYSKGASFFITVTLEDRRPLFGHVEAGSMHLSPLGEEVLASLEAIPRFHPEITLYGHVAMPDHVHFNCHLAAGLKEPLRVLGRAIAGFKAATTRLPQAQCACGSTPASGLTPREQGAALLPRIPGMRSGGARPPGVRWRAGYHDHLCLSRRFIDSTERYIAYNPLKARFRPESAYVRAFAEDRCLELGRGNEEIAFDRAACLDVNAEIIRIATSGPGLALYFTEHGLARLR